MKSFLTKYIALAMVATTSTTSAVNAVELRGFNNEEAMVEVQASCVDGANDGQRSVKRLWKRTGEDCDNVWDLESRVNRMKNRNYPSNPRNWRDKAYNRCARDGVEKQVQRIEEQCLNNDPSQCTDLGETAAEIIVFNNVCSPDFGESDTYRSPDYKETCKEVAYGICRGQISTKINEYCSNVNVKSNRLLRLMNLCEDRVDDLVGQGSEELEELESIAN